MALENNPVLFTIRLTLLGRHCYVNPISTVHEFQDIYKLTAWAKSILFGEASYNRPPTSKDFDHVAKRRRAGQPPQALAPEIHVHIPTFGSPSQPPRNALTDRAGQNRINIASNHGQQNVIDLTDDDFDDTPLIAYPPISQVLQELHTVMPLLNYPQYYEDALISNGIIYVNSAAHIDHSFFVDIVHMPKGAVGDFLEHAATLTHRALKGKGKGKTIVMKKEEENY